MSTLPSLLSGAMTGIMIAMPIGPMAILCVNRTMNSGLRAGLSTGFGASTVHVAYSAVILLGLHEGSSFLDANRSILEVAGCGLMVLFAWRMLRARAVPTSTNPLRGGSMLKNFLSAVLFNSINPMLFMLLVGCFATAIGPPSLKADNTGLLLAGLFLGSAGWWLCLSSAVAALRTKVSPRLMRASNVVAAVVMLGFGMTALMPVIR